MISNGGFWINESKARPPRRGKTLRIVHEREMNYLNLYSTSLETYKYFIHKWGGERFYIIIQCGATNMKFTFHFYSGSYCSTFSTRAFISLRFFFLLPPRQCATARLMWNSCPRCCIIYKLHTSFILSKGEGFISRFVSYIFVYSDITTLQNSFGKTLKLRFNLDLIGNDVCFCQRGIFFNAFPKGSIYISLNTYLITQQ